MDETLVILGYMFGIGIPVATGILFAARSAAKKSQERWKIRFKNAEDLEGKIFEKKYVPFQKARGLLDSSASEQCILSIELKDGSKKIYHYYGNMAERVYFEHKVGDTVKFKKGFRPYVEVI